MSASTTALGIVALVIACAAGVGLLAVRRMRMTPEQYIVGGRSFGSLLLWFLMAGEIYTSFTFLGAAGWAYGKGAPAFYILCYGPVAYALSYFIAPLIWRAGKDRGFLTGADFFESQYGSKRLGSLVALVGVIFLIPYVTLQLSGLQILLSIAGYGTIDARLAVGFAFALITAFVFVAGLRGTAWASVVKDALVLGAVIVAGLIIPAHFYHSPAAVISGVLARRPQWFVLAPGFAPSGVAWFVSTVVLSALGFYMWPQSFAAVFSAKSGDALRRNAVFLPFYQLMLLLVYFAGFTALLVVPGLKNPDESFLVVLQRFYPPWVLGLIAGAGYLAALVPVTAQLLAAASLVTKNLLGGLREASTSAQTAWTRWVVAIVASLALGFWLLRPPTLVELLLLGYNGVTQFFPGVIFALTWRRASAAGVGGGILAGIATLIVAAVKGGASSIAGINTGLIALAVNATLCVVLSLIRPARARAAKEVAPAG